MFLGVSLCIPNDVMAISRAVESSLRRDFKKFRSEAPQTTLPKTNSSPLKIGNHDFPFVKDPFSGGKKKRFF